MKLLLVLQTVVEDKLLMKNSSNKWVIENQDNILKIYQSCTHLMPKTENSCTGSVLKTKKHLNVIFIQCFKMYWLKQLKYIFVSSNVRILFNILASNGSGRSGKSVWKAARLDLEVVGSNLTENIYLGLPAFFLAKSSRAPLWSFGCDSVDLWITQRAMRSPQTSSKLSAHHETVWNNLNSSNSPASTCFHCH